MALVRSVVRAVSARADNHGIATSAVACSATAFSVWDTLINFDNEVEYIWGGSNGWVKWMYLFIRHMPYLAQGSILTLVGASDHLWESSQCRAWITYQLVFAEVLTVAVEVVLIVRIYAMFNRNWIILTAVYVLFAAEITAMCTILALTIPRMEFTPQCFIISTPSMFPSYWTISLGFETSLFILTIMKFFMMFVAGQISRQSIMLVLMRDGTWAYAIIFVILLLNTLMYELENSTLAGICYFWELSIMSFAGSHLLLNLRRTAMEPRSGSRSTFTPSSFEMLPSPQTPRSQLRFAHNDSETEPTVIELDTLRASG